ncbi:MAG: 2-dehydropantoate 2-reductase [Tepidiforma sp.]|nr:MAG: 2-dehydropantoate 2-reductase [Tepidiforma sp.]
MTRFVVYGAGAIGATIGARLHEAGGDVLLIARGAHLEALRSHGLRFNTPGGSKTLRLPVASSPAEVDWRGDEVVFLAMKTQDTAPALVALEAAAGNTIPVICAQNGVENERLAARRFRSTYAMLVALPATHLEPGVVTASGAPLSGCLHAGRFPAGVDPLIESVCGALDTAGFRSLPAPDVMELKYRKLLLNLGNALDVVVGRSSWGAGGEVGEILTLLRDEGEACYSAAGIRAVSPEEYRQRVTAHYRSVPVSGEDRSGSSTLQSVLRGRTETEVDYLNGEIILLGLQHGVPTPANRVVRDLAVRLAANGSGPGRFSPREVLDLVAAAV